MQDTFGLYAALCRTLVVPGQSESVRTDQRIQGITYPDQVAPADVRVDLGRRAALMSEELLDVAQVHSVLQEMGRKAVSEGMERDLLGEARPLACEVEHPLCRSNTDV